MSMRVTGFQVVNYRCVEDSGWVDVDDMAVIVGKNESGKTSVLKALSKFNAFDKAQYDIENEWPRGRWQERASDKPVITVRFHFSEDEIKQLAELDKEGTLNGVVGVDITKKYDAQYTMSFFPVSPRSIHSESWLSETAIKYFGAAPDTASDSFQEQYQKHFDAFLKKIPIEGAYSAFTSQVPNLKEALKALVSTEPDEEVEADNSAVVALGKGMDEALQAISISPWSRVVALVKKWIPIFIYMDDHKAFTGSTDLEEIQQRRDNNSLTAEDKTTIMIMEMAGLDLDKVVKQGGEKDKRPRARDIKVASECLTRMMAPYWSQNSFQVKFDVDEQRFYANIIDDRSDNPIALEEKSKGFQWYFTFDLMFRYETQGQFKGAIILLDEPGLHLHASAQADLMERIKEYSRENQLIYTTHLPFMIDYQRWDNIYVAEHVMDAGTKIHKDWVTADKDAKFTLLAALGINWSSSLLFDRYNLLVEGITDYWFLTTISELLSISGEEGLHSELGITYAGSGAKAATLATYLNSQASMNVALLLDCDQEGKNAYQQIVNNLILKDKHVLRIDKVLGITRNCAIEDLFYEEHYLGIVRTAYKQELGKKTLSLDNTTRPLVERVQSALASKGIENFHKGRVAKQFMRDVSQKGISDIPVETVENFKTLIAAINEVVVDWKRSEDLRKQHVGPALLSS